MTLLECEEVKGSQTLLKLARQQSYHICSLVRECFRYKKSFLVISEILRPFFNLLTLDDKYSLGNRENLLQSGTTDLFGFFAAFLKSTFDFELFEKKVTFIAYIFPKSQTGRDAVQNCLRSPISEQPIIVNILKVPKHCWNLWDSSFLICFQHSKKTFVQKSCYQSYPKSQGCLFTH